MNWGVNVKSDVTFSNSNTSEDITKIAAWRFLNACYQASSCGWITD
jgi:hypothetical protein